MEKGKVFDSSGNGLHGTLIDDAHIVSDPERGSVLSLDGKGDHVDCGNGPAFHITGSLTVSCWVKAGEFDNQYPTIMAQLWSLWWYKDNGDMYFRSGALDVGVERYTSKVQAYAAMALDDGRGHHVVGVLDGTNISIYLDGVLGDSKSYEGRIVKND